MEIENIQTIEIKNLIELCNKGDFSSCNSLGNID